MLVCIILSLLLTTVTIVANGANDHVQLREKRVSELFGKRTSNENDMMLFLANINEEEMSMFLQRLLFEWRKARKYWNELNNEELTQVEIGKRMSELFGKRSERHRSSDGYYKKRVSELFG
ncbi:hypothetical protein T02_1113 [Trichinella nativa]|uniref:Uncharacterized protein n=3 Tax=Trichinella TaxID=6333 RepID=A0A0V1LNC0_9BILA|nr:hypothetical protein T05_14709 [Trichinella murrelli]KRX57998.1 hypothetical protein T09_15538 [Trichinella sp. T9]KRY20595.1 hypothetical protein T12_16397 [Trichinella patagoniensis]KRZ60887.1 hypothetical protein T02_1113 [Trichinella nativa]